MNYLKKIFPRKAILIMEKFLNHEPTPYWSTYKPFNFLGEQWLSSDKATFSKN